MLGFESVTRESYTLYSIVPNVLSSMASSEPSCYCVVLLGLICAHCCRVLCSVDEPGLLVGSAVDGQLGGMQHGPLGPTVCILVHSL